MAPRVIKSPESLQIEIRIEVWLRLVYKPRDPLRDLDTVIMGVEMPRHPESRVYRDSENFQM
jgi:hypothetical protein